MNFIWVFEVGNKRIYESSVENLELCYNKEKLLLFIDSSAYSFGCLFRYYLFHQIIIWLFWRTFLFCFYIFVVNINENVIFVLDRWT